MEAIHTKPIAASNRLHELGLTSEVTAKIVEAAVAGNRRATANHAKNAPGTFAYHDALARMREVLCVLDGWERYECNGAEGVANYERKICIRIASGDAGTGMPECIPKPTSKKGSTAKEAVDSNQRELSELSQDFAHSFRSEEDRSSDLIHWYLLIHIDGDTVRAELSCPTSFSVGSFCSYEQRIIIPLSDLKDFTPAVNKKSQSVETEFDVPVSRKKA